MTQDEIIEMTRQAGFEDFVRWSERYPHEVQRWVERMETFAKLVAAKEREACAKVCDEYSAIGKIEEFDRGWLACAKNIAFVIRARGET